MTTIRVPQFVTHKALMGHATRRTMLSLETSCIVAQSHTCQSSLCHAITHINRACTSTIHSHKLFGNVMPDFKTTAIIAIYSVIMAFDVVAALWITVTKMSIMTNVFNILNSEKTILSCSNSIKTSIRFTGKHWKDDCKQSGKQMWDGMSVQ